MITIVRLNLWILQWEDGFLFLPLDPSGCGVGRPLLISCVGYVGGFFLFLPSHGGLKLPR